MQALRPILLAGLVALGWQVGNAALRVKSPERTVVVKGLFEREVPADIAIWPLTFQEASGDLNGIYTGSSTVTVYSGDVAAVRAAMHSALKPDMIEEATKNARSVAEKFAADSESRLGKIRSAQQGQFSIENRDSTPPHRIRWRDSGRTTSQVIVKLSRPEPVSVNPAVVRRRSAFLPGEVSPHA